MEILYDKTLASELLQMAEVDQVMRLKAIEDETAWDASVDEANTSRLVEIIEQDGWPTIPKVGSEASHAAWLLVQHAANLDLMKRCLKLMKDAPRGAVTPSNIAFLVDRVLVMESKPQIYGTQFQGTEEGMKVYPIENPDEVDTRRACVGLSTFAENIIRLNEPYHKPIIN